MSSLYDGRARIAIIERLERLTPQNQQRWGKMSIAQLMPHLGDSLRRALGDTPSVPPTSGLGRFWLVRYLYIYHIKWPQGKIQSPAGSFRTPSTGWDSDRKIIMDLIERFVTTRGDTLSPIHPTLGRMTSRDWGTLLYKHLDHHLRQFSA
jgi:hypothetical protein